MAVHQHYGMVILAPPGAVEDGATVYVQPGAIGALLIDGLGLPQRQVGRTKADQEDGKHHPKQHNRDGQVAHKAHQRQAPSLADHPARPMPTQLQCHPVEAGGTSSHRTILVFRPASRNGPWHDPAEIDGTPLDARIPSILAGVTHEAGNCSRDEGNRALER